MSERKKAELEMDESPFRASAAGAKEMWRVAFRALFVESKKKARSELMAQEKMVGRAKKQKSAAESDEQSKAERSQSLAQLSKDRAQQKKIEAGDQAAER